MCGIAGGAWRRDDRGLETGLRAALEQMLHRGPDDSGYQVTRSASACVALGQTRLSVIDLSSGGHQPMLSQDGRFALVFNGEIYNYRELRAELAALGRSFRSESDTEVLLAAWSEWGPGCLRRFDGMFALAVHDRQRNRLTCARDAFGIKPFFYAQDERGFSFASEQRALSALRGGAHQPDLQRAYDYLVHADYDSQERTFVSGVLHLQPGMLLEVDLSSMAPASAVSWWRLAETLRFDGSFADAVDSMRESFLNSVRLQLRSDVPLGVTLSGGIDSSAVVCAMRYLEPDAPIHTFSYIADDPCASEEHWVDLVNAAVGAIPHRVEASAAELLADLDAVVREQGEPFGSTSVYAQRRVFQLARANGITVTLDGQGADELLAGYKGYPGQRMLSLLETGRYLGMHRFARAWGGWPGRSYAQAWMYLGQAVVPDLWYDAVFNLVRAELRPKWLNINQLTDAGVLFSVGRSRAGTTFRGRRVTEQLAKSVHRHGLMHLLRHLDRNAMASSIESRVPFLTIPFAELALSLPEDYLISDGGETKHAFRAAMRGIVPDSILDRRDKIGFVTPQGAWLLELMPEVRERLRRAAVVPFLDSATILQTLDRVSAGKSAPSGLVWRWLNYVIWYEQQGF